MTGGWTPDSGNYVQTILEEKNMFHEDILVPNIGLSNWPAVAVYKDKIYLVHEGMKHDGNLWWTYSSDGGSTWKTDYKIDNVATSGPPALVVFQEKLYCFHRARDKKSQLHYTVSNDGEIWSGDSKAVDGIGLSESPAVAVAVAVAVYNNKIYLIHQGMDHHTLWWSTFDGSTWTDDQPIDNVATSGSPALVVFQQKLYCFYQEPGFRRGLVYTVYDGNKWSNSTVVERFRLGRPPAVAVYNDKIYFFHEEISIVPPSIGAGPSGQAEHKGTLRFATFDGGSTWSEDRRIEDVGTSGPPALAVFKEKLYCFHQGMKNSGQLWYTFLAWVQLDGENSYCYCACNGGTDNKRSHTSSHTMNLKAGAPYFYAVLTKDDGSINFPTGAVLTIEEPDGTKYNRDIQEENQLVIMSGSSVRCLIVKDPKPGDWKMTMKVPEGVGFHCECNTVPSKDVYSTITNALSKRDLKQHDKRDTADIKGWIGSALVGIITAAATIITGAGGRLVASFLGFTAGGATWLLGKNDSSRDTAEYMSFTSRARPIVEKLVTDLKEKGFKETISFYYYLIGKNLSAEEWKVILTTQPWNAASIVLVYAQVFKIIEHMTKAEEQNAVRHVLWQCLLKKRFGAEFATKLGDAHEKARPGSPADNKADEINNIKGQQLADEVRSDLECFKRAREMWEAGELQTRTDLEGDPT
ncbi:glycosyl hydrolase, BNR repeat protein [Kalymmatonema gypsitolerans NIES-4073]|nr:glycosyl hydrolase, BNR repeat protein [Scytonema sp. NIES-4073]